MGALKRVKASGGDVMWLEHLCPIAVFLNAHVSQGSHGVEGTFMRVRCNLETGVAFRAHDSIMASLRASKTCAPLSGWWGSGSPGC